MKNLLNFHTVIKSHIVSSHLSSAYEVLTDPEKKKIYDVYGEAGLNQQQSGGSNVQFRTADAFRVFEQYHIYP
jgi:DnaJ-class molecular chaperone